MRRPLQCRSLPMVLTTMLLVDGANAQVVLGIPDEASTAAPVRQPAPPALRLGMAEIRKLVLNAHSLITHRRLSPDQGRHLAADLKRQIAAIRPIAGNVESILRDIEDGAEQIGNGPPGAPQLDALERIDAALARYPQLIDDPDWKPLR